MKTIGRPRVHFLTRFWSRVEKADGCWVWRGCDTGGGYGSIRIGGGGSPHIFAHRASFQIHFGKIPKGMMVCHRCDNRKCCNPDHLFLGTGKENAWDMLNKGRHNSAKETGIPKMTSEMVKEIRINYTGKVGEQRRLSERLGVSPSCICKLLKQKSWVGVS